jgi:MFS family permease
MRGILRSSLDHGLLNPPVRWLMLAAPFGFGVAIYGFYAAQPYLLELYGDSEAYAVAAMSAALVAGAQILGGVLASRAARVFRRRMSVLLAGSALTTVVLVLMGLVSDFWVATGLLAVWATMFAMLVPVRQAFLNGLIPSAQRATVLSSDNLLGSAGGVVAQPAFGRVADSWSYGTSYVVSAGVHLLALPFIVLARREGVPSDRTDDRGPTRPVEEAVDETVAEPALAPPGTPALEPV